MKNHSEKIYKGIIDLLKKSKFPLTMTEIANKLKIARPTAVKYIMVLEVKGKIRLRKVGVAKSYYIDNRPIKKETKEEEENWEEI